MRYSIKDMPPIKEWILYTFQYIFSVLPATILITQICNTPINAGFISAGLGTLTFLLCTNFQAPVCTSNSGATVSAIVGALALGKSVEQQFTGVILGGLCMALIYCVTGILVKKCGIKWLTKIMPPIVNGTTILIIGITLGLFVPQYAMINNEYSLLGVGIAFATMIVTALISCYGKGVMKTLPFLGGLVFGYLLVLILSLTGIFPETFNLKNFLSYNLLVIPDFSFLHFDLKTFDWSTFPQILISFTLVSMAAMTEHIADMQAVSKVIGENLCQTPGLHKTLIGDGLSSLVGVLSGSQCTTTYSEYTGTMAISKVASVSVTLTTALGLIVLGFLRPFNEFLASLPNCVFAGIAIPAYGLIALTGIETLLKSNIDFNNNSNRFIIAAMIICGTSGLYLQFGQLNISGITLAMIVGILMNCLLNCKNE